MKTGLRTVARARVARCQASAQQRGSALLMTLIFMAVLARVALSAVDAASLGTSLVLNYRDHERVFSSAEALLFAVDARLLQRIQIDGPQAALDAVPEAEVELGVPPAASLESGAAMLAYQIHVVDFMAGRGPDGGADGVYCNPLYQLTVRASGLRAGTRVRLSLERSACCSDNATCAAGDFYSMSRRWRRFSQEQRSD